MEEVWISKDVSVWEDNLSKIDERVEKFGKPGYADLDKWFFGTLPDLIDQKRDKDIGSDELVKIVEWKLRRGQYRPALLNFAKQVSQEGISSASKKAFEILKEIENSTDEGYRQKVGEALDYLTKLKGIGPATASAILTAASPHVPYMSDAALLLTISQKPKYTKGEYLILASALRGKAAELSTEGKTWTAKEVERALQSQELEENSSKGKRKRS